MSRKWWLGLVLVLAVGGCAYEKGATTEDLLDADRAFAALSRAEGPKTAFEAYLVDNALQLPDGVDPVRGGATIAAGFDDAPGLTLDWTPQEGGVSEAGDMGWTWGVYEAMLPAPDGETLTRTGKYLNVWVRDDAGDWRVLVDMGNSDEM